MNSSRGFCAGFTCAGFTYVGVLALVALMGIGLASIGQWWQTTRMREKETELLFVGEEFRRALLSYRDSSSGLGEYPRRLEDLLEDRRLPGVRRHLRRIYDDPMTGRADWVLLRAGDRIVGVASRSESMPFRRAGFPSAFSDFAQARRYRDWVFAAEPVAGETVAAQNTAGGRAGPSGPGPLPQPVAPEPPALPAEPPESPPSLERDPCEVRYANGLARCKGLPNPSRELFACKESAYADLRSCRLGR